MILPWLFINMIYNVHNCNNSLMHIIKWIADVDMWIKTLQTNSLDLFGLWLRFPLYCVIYRCKIKFKKCEWCICIMKYFSKQRWLISTSQTFRSWVVIFHLRQPMEFLSLNLYDTPGLAPRMNVLYWGPGDFPSKLLEQGYVEERLKSSFRKFYGRYGDLIQQYEVSLSRMLNDILWSLTNTVTSPTNQTFHQFRDLDTELDLHRLWVVSLEHLQRVWHASRGTLTLPDTWFPSPILGLFLFHLLMLQLLRPNSSNLPCLYSTLHLEYPLVLSRFCLQHCQNTR